MKTTTKNINENQRGYGLFSLLSLIVGVIIGSGIFVKNESIVSITGSPAGALVAWGIMSFFIILMVFAFIEITSSTIISKKNGTISRWMTTFINPSAGKYIGIFLLFIYQPIVSLSLAKYAGFKIIDIASDSISIWTTYIGTLVIGLLIILLINGINLWSEKTSKNFGTIGMFIKTIPLWTIIFIMFIAMATGAGSMPTFENPDISSDKVTTFGTIILALPPIMFSFEGFVYSASMQNEAKSEKAFMTAWVGGMLFVIAVYILYSFSIVYIVKENFTFAGAIASWVGEKNASWLVPLMESIIILSIMTGLNGQTITSVKSFASLSAEEIIPDKNGDYLRLNSQLKPQFAQYALLAITFIWFAILSTFDAIYLATSNTTEVMASTSYASDITTLWSFFGYAIIMMAGIANRKTNKVKVDKKIYFIPTAFLASIGIFGVVLYQTFDVFRSVIVDHDWMKISILLITFVSPFILVKVFDKYNKKIDNKNKEITLNRFWNLEIDPIFMNDLGNAFQTNKYPFLLRYPKKDEIKKYT